MATRRVSREVRHEENVYAEGRGDEDIDPLQGHIHGPHDHGPDPVGLDELHIRYGSGLSEAVGPGPCILAGQKVVLSATGQVVEGRPRLRIQDDTESAQWVLGGQGESHWVWFGPGGLRRPGDSGSALGPWPPVPPR